MIFIWLMLTLVYVKLARIQFRSHKDGYWTFQTSILLDFNLLHPTKQLVGIYLIKYLILSLQKLIFKTSWKLVVLRVQSRHRLNLPMVFSINISQPRKTKLQPRMETQLCLFCVVLLHSMVSTTFHTSTQRNSIPGTNSTMRTFLQWGLSKTSGRSASQAGRSPLQFSMREQTSSRVCCSNSKHLPKISISMMTHSRKTTFGFMAPPRKKVFASQLCNEWFNE